MCFDSLLCCCTDDDLGLPKHYECIEYLGKGAFGYVVQCRNRATNEIVAIKISEESSTLDEVRMMKRLMSHDLHQHNIVKFLGSFNMPSGPALVMEKLDISLWQYIDMLKGDLMPLSDIRDIIKQIAVALDALKSIGVIHGDMKPDNIMMVDHLTRPFRVKLIDFGLAVLTSETRLGMLFQHRWFRAPEVILALPLTEAIDMWSLGCLLAMIFTSTALFRGWNEYAIMECIVYHCGQPPDHLLDKGLLTKRYFSRTETNGWTIKKRLTRDKLNADYEANIKKKRLDNKNKAEASQARQCLDLLRAMLTVDPAERITPAEVLLHPFIVEASVSAPHDRTNIEGDHRYPLSKIPLSRRLPVQPAVAANRLSLEDEDSSDSLDFSISDSEDSVTSATNIQPAHRSPSPTIPPSCVIHVQPATAENTLRLEDVENLDSLEIHISKTSRSVSWTATSDCEDPVTAPEERETTNIQPPHHSSSPTITPSRVLHVQPAAAENTLSLEDVENLYSLDFSISDSEDSVTSATNIQPAHHSSSPTIPPSRVIHVRPATAENTLRLEDVENLKSLEIHISKTSRSVSWTSTSDCEDPVTAPEERETTNIQPAHHSSSPTIPTSHVIHVLPAAAENTLRSEDQKDTDSLQAGLKNTSESPVTITKNDATLTEDDATVTFNDCTANLASEDLTYYGKKQVPQSPPPVTDLSSKKKKKKNRFRRFFSWMKKTFCCCVTGVDDD